MLCRWLNCISFVAFLFASTVCVSAATDDSGGEESAAPDSSATDESNPDIRPPQNASQDPSTSSSDDLDQITPAELVALIRQLQQQVSTNTLAISDTSVRTQTLRDEIAKIQDQLEKNYSAQLTMLEEQQRVLQSVTRRDQDGRHILRLDANMANSEEFSRDLRDAVDRTRPTHGTLTIRNPLTYDQTVVINNEQYVVKAGSRVKQTVPVGNVVTRVPDGKTYTWFIGEPDYEMNVKLVDSRPSESVVVRRPVVANSPVASTPSRSVAAPMQWTPVETYDYYPSF